MAINTIYNYSNRLLQGLHLWSIEDKCLIRQFTGLTQGYFTIYSCFGGGSENAFIATGSEDKEEKAKVFVYHILRENPIAELSGHVKTVNCVTWNPVYPKILVSASDDCTLRVWGPSARYRNASGSGAGAHWSKNGHAFDSSASGAGADNLPHHCGNGVI